MTAPKTPAAQRITDARAAAVLHRLRRTGATLTAAELAAGVGCAARTLTDTLTRLKKDGLIIGKPEWLPGKPKKAPVALWRYYAAKDAEWPDWLPMPQEAPETVRHCAIKKPWLHGVPASVWQLGEVAA